LRKSSLVDVGLDLIGGFLSQIAIILGWKIIACNSKQATGINWNKSSQDNTQS
jgi:hypothetical protein